MHFIINPETNTPLSIFTKNGKTVLKNHLKKLKYYMTGGSDPEEPQVSSKETPEDGEP